MEFCLNVVSSVSVCSSYSLSCGERTSISSFSVKLPSLLSFTDGRRKVLSTAGQFCLSTTARRSQRAETVLRRVVQELSTASSADETSIVYPPPEYTPGPLDGLFLQVFREKMSQQVGWDSQKPGYDGLLDVVKHLYASSSKLETEKATVRVYTALFPGWLVQSFRRVILPIADGKLGTIMMAVVTRLTCQWLMGPCTVNQVTLANGRSQTSGVLVQRCKFLEESKCAGICTHMCKIPTQKFIKEAMGVPLAMEPNFTDFSCQFKFGVEALPWDQDPCFQTPCLSICPTATARNALRSQVQRDQCPQVQ